MESYGISVSKTGLVSDLGVSKCTGGVRHSGKRCGQVSELGL